MWFRQRVFIQTFYGAIDSRLVDFVDIDRFNGDWQLKVITGLDTRFQKTYPIENYKTEVEAVAGMRSLLNQMGVKYVEIRPFKLKDLQR